MRSPVPQKQTGTMARKIKPFVWTNFSRKQRMLLSWWTDGSPVRDSDGIIADGSIRSGKTLVMSFSFVLWAMTSFDGYDFAMCGKTVGSFRRNVLNTLKRILLGRGYLIEDRRTENLLIVSDGEVENYFYIFGGRDESSQDLIQGMTLAGVYLDEVALMPESFVNQATARCSVEGSKWWFNCNPAGPAHWFKKQWLDKRLEKNLLHLHFTMQDNLSLSAQMIERYAGMYTGVFYQRFIQGLWVAAEGLIYDMFDVQRHVIDHTPGSGRKFVSCDYGTQNATVFLLWEETPEAWVCYREYYYSGRDERRQKTDGQFADELADWLGDTKIERIVVDPSAASFIAELRRRGWHVKKAKNDVLDGIRATGEMLNAGQILIDRSCTHLIEELQGYVWDKKAADRGEDKPVKISDHCVDSLRYGCFTVIYKKNGMEVLK